MRKNTISVNVSFANGSDQTVLDNVGPKEALDDYLFPDPGMPITYSLRATSHDGKSVSVVITKDRVEIISD